MEKPQVNNIIRLFSIAALGDNRDDLVSLGRGKNTNCSEGDDPMNRVDAIFSRWALQFNDPSLVITPPERAMYLSLYHMMNPNDPQRIAIKRDEKFLLKMY